MPDVRNVRSVDFDSIDIWHPALTSVLAPVVGKPVIDAVRASSPEYVEDARDVLFELSDKGQVVQSVLDWLSRSTLVAYHASRLTESDVKCVCKTGLIPLRSSDRRTRIVRALSVHPNWGEVSAGLDDAIESNGPGGRAGTREGQVHLTLSGGGLRSGFDHYLRYGSEFDYHVAYDLLGEAGLALLAADGDPTLVSVEMPGDVALRAAHPFSTVEDVISCGNLPNVVDQFLCSWAFRLSRPSFQSHALKVDCGFILFERVPSSWIAAIETIDLSPGA